MGGFEFIVDRQRRLLHTRYFGRVGAADIERALVQGNRDYIGYHSLIDFTDATLAPVSSAEVRALTALAVTIEPPHILSAFVAPADLEFGLVRMYDALADGDLPQRREVFHDLDSALAWFDEHLPG